MGRFADVWAMTGRGMNLARRAARVAVDYYASDEKEKASKTKRRRKVNWRVSRPNAEVWRGKVVSRLGEGGAGGVAGTSEGRHGENRKREEGENGSGQEAWEREYK